MATTLTYDPLAGHAHGAEGRPPAGKTPGASWGALAGGGAVAAGLANTHGGDLGARVPGANAAQLPNNLSPEQNPAIANRQPYWDNWVKANQGALANFRSNRSQQWANINAFRNSQNLAGSFNSPQWNNYRTNVNDFRNNRALEVNNSVQNHFDNNFNANWWAGSGWYNGQGSGYANGYGYGYGGGNSWWWWGTATLATADAFLALEASQQAASQNQAATSQAPVYDYGVNVVYQGSDVYVDGKKAATATQYSQQAIALANEPAAQPTAPAPPEAGQPPAWRLGAGAGRTGRGLHVLSAFDR